MKWEKPTFVEISMNAEIGGYQGDDGNPYTTDGEIRDVDERRSFPPVDVLTSPRAE